MWCEPRVSDGVGWYVYIYIYISVTNSRTRLSGHVGRREVSKIKIIVPAFVPAFVATGAHVHAGMDDITFPSYHMQG